jgi:hypothetical protein
MAAATISVDEFQALEQKVLQTVELIKKERELRASAEARVHQLESDHAELSAAHASVLVEVAELRDQVVAGYDTIGELEALKRERENVRQRVEVMLAQMDELA